MQRQSLGSPAPQLHIHGAHKIDNNNNNNTLLTNDLPSPSLYRHTTDDIDDQDNKATKPRRFSSASTSSSSLSPISFSLTNAEKLIHLVPLLTLFCFLVLYLVSHHPTQTDLSQFNGFKRISSRLENINKSADSSSEIIDEMSGVNEIRGRGDVLGIRSVRNLQEEMSGGGGAAASSLKSRPHRKVADF